MCSQTRSISPCLPYLLTECYSAPPSRLPCLECQEKHMIHPVTRSMVFRILVCMLAVTQLVACGGGGGGSASVGGSTPGGTGTTQTSSLSLSWVAPVARTDGTPISLADIEGYKVYYGTSAGSYTGVADITDGSQTSVTITGITSGTYHVAMTTYDTNGLESPYSAEVIKTTQ